MSREFTYFTIKYAIIGFWSKVEISKHNILFNRLILELVFNHEELGYPIFCFVSGQIDVIKEDTI